MPTRPRPRVHARDHEHGGADPQLIHYEDVGDSGAGGTPSFAATSFTSVSPDETPMDVPVDTFSGDTTVFSESGGFVRILGPGFYQLAAYMKITFDTVPAADEWAIMFLRVYDSGDSEIGYSLEDPIAQLANNRQDFPAGLNRVRYLQRITALSLTSATDFPVEVRPEINFSDDGANLNVRQTAVWGFKVGPPLAASVSD